jgi:hypothetical protein
MFQVQGMLHLNFNIFSNDYVYSTHMNSREYWMIYRGPGFLVVVWFGSSAPSTVRKLDRRNAGRARKRNNLQTGEEGEGEGEEPNHKTARKLDPQ